MVFNDIANFFVGNLGQGLAAGLLPDFLGSTVYEAVFVIHPGVFRYKFFIVFIVSPFIHFGDKSAFGAGSFQLIHAEGLFVDFDTGGDAASHTENFVSNNNEVKVGGGAVFGITGVMVKVCTGHVGHCHGQSGFDYPG